MSWDYRVVRDCNGELAIYEVGYEDGKPDNILESPVGLVAANLEELEKDLDYMQQALSKPILDMEQILNHMASK